jgi:hypothetical protein
MTCDFFVTPARLKQVSRTGNLGAQGFGDALIWTPDKGIRE